MLRAAGPDDVIAGVPARWVAEPSSTQEAADLLRANQDKAVVVRGGASKMDWGAPPRELDLIVDTRRMTGVVEHAAGDLIAVVRAGTPMAGLRRLGDQQLALDAGLPGATVGGTVATAASGPRRMLYGTGRELLIGMTVVRPDGTVARSGGKVVKNVAGYDLAKLFHGSYGTLGLVTECVFRLHPLPAGRAVVTAPLSDAEQIAAVLRARLVPAACEVNAPRDGAPELAVLLEGVTAAQRAARVAALIGGTIGPEPAWWGRYPWPRNGIGMKIGVPLSGVDALLRAARGIAGVRGSAGTGVLYAHVTEPAHVATLRAVAEHATVLTAPIGLGVDRWGPIPAIGLMRRVKDRFDPGHRFAPGRFAGGI